MLDQRRAKEKGYITLKEAAEIANYTPDYVGQLIRAGKIKGEQVYSSVAWVTTEEEVQAYLQDKARTVQQSETKEVLTFDRSVLMYVGVGVVAVAALLLQYVLYVSLDVTLQQAYESHDKTVTMHVVQ